jgi:hypothetical protein
MSTAPASFIASEPGASVSASREDYVFAKGQDRERTAVERLLLGPNADHFQSILGNTLGWLGRSTWYALRIPKSYLIPASTLPEQFKGDVDLMGGPLTLDPRWYAATLAEVQERYPGLGPNWWPVAAGWDTLAAGGLVWPPTLEQIAAVETKCVYLNAAGQLRGEHLGSHAPNSKQNRLRHLRMQVTNLSQMGFDRVALLWLAVTEPVLTPTGDSTLWMEAAFRGIRAIEQLRGLTNAAGTAPAFGEIVVACSAVPGGTETQRGTAGGVVRTMPPALHHPPGSEAAEIRASIETVLHRAFSKSIVRRSMPVVLRACASTSCRTVFVAQSTGPSCPECASSAL